MNEEYDENLDKHVLQAIVNGDIQPRTLDKTFTFECIVGGRRLWVGNYPYSYGTIGGLRPSRSTIKLLKEYIDKVK